MMLTLLPGLFGLVEQLLPVGFAESLLIELDVTSMLRVSIGCSGSVFSLDTSSSSPLSMSTAFNFSSSVKLIERYIEEFMNPCKGVNNACSIVKTNCGSFGLIML